MNRREALAKATITTSDAATGLLDPSQGTAFIRKLKEKTSLANAMRQEVRVATAGEINKIATGARVIRAATENADDGYRAGATFATVPFTTRKIRLPWEITEDVFHENIEGQGLEATLTDEMTTQFALDLEDLEINGDTAAGAGADQAFLQINDGILKMITAAAVAGRNINGSTIAGGIWGKDHMFEALYAMPNVYRRSGNLRWIMSPARAINWWESVTQRATNGGDAALLGEGGSITRPLGVPTLEVPGMPDNTVLLADPRNFVRVISWQVRKRRVTGETDAELAAKDKRFYVFFIKHDVVIEEVDAIVRVHTLAAVEETPMPEFVNTLDHPVRVTDENGQTVRVVPGQVISVDGVTADRLDAIDGLDTPDGDQREAWEQRNAPMSEETSGKESLEQEAAAARIRARTLNVAVPLNQVIGDDNAPVGPPSGTITTKTAVASEGGLEKAAFMDHERLPEDADNDRLNDVERAQAEARALVEEVHQESLESSAPAPKPKAAKRSAKPPAASSD